MRIIILLTVFVLLTGARKLERQADEDENEEGVVTIRRSSVSSPRSNVVRKEVEEEQETEDVDTEYYAAYADDAAYSYSYSYSYGNSSYYGYGYGYGDDDGGDDDATNGDDGPVRDDDATNVVVIFDRAQPRPMFSFTPLFTTGMGSPPLRSSRAQERDVDVEEEGEEEEAVSSSKDLRPATVSSDLQSKKKVDVSQFLRGRQSATPLTKNADRQEAAQEGWLSSALQSALQRFALK